MNLAIFIVVLYSFIDQREADQVYNISRAFGPTFIARDLTPGMDWREEIAANICSADMVLVLWSANAARSNELDKELHIATVCDRKIVPVMLDDTSLPPVISWRHAIDWRNK